MTAIGRRHFLAQLAGLAAGLAACGAAPARPGPSAKLARVGFLSSTTAEGAEEQEAAFKARFAELGWAEGRNVAFTVRFSDGDEKERLDYYAAEMVKLGMDVVVAKTASSIQAMRRLGPPIPVVMDAQGSDPVNTGFIESFAHPGTGITGVGGIVQGTREKRVEILHKSFPNVAKVGILWTRGPAGDVPYQATADAAVKLGLEPVSMRAERAEDIAGLFESELVPAGQGLIALESAILASYASQIVSLAASHRLPGVYPMKQFDLAGALVYYGPDNLAINRRAADYVDKILRGANPSELPVEQPSQVEFVVNLVTAKAMGVTIPQAILAQATRVVQ